MRKFKKLFMSGLVSLSVLTIPALAFANSTPNFQWSGLTTYLNASSAYNFTPQSSSTITLEVVQYVSPVDGQADMEYLFEAGYPYDYGVEILGNYTSTAATKNLSVATGKTYSITLENAVYYNTKNPGSAVNGNGYVFYN